MYFLEYGLKNIIFRYLVKSMQNQAWSTKWEVTLGNRAVELLPPLVYFSVHFFWLEFWTFFLKFYTVNLC